jgi:uncharacterized protein (TIGR00661 family)
VRILYGLCGIGMGHATRSKVSIAHLRSRGHDVLAFAPGSAFAPIAQAFPGRAIETAGFAMRTKEGELDPGDVLRFNVSRLPEMLARNARAWHVAKEFRPDAVVTDHDVFSWLYAKACDLPIISIDNSQIAARCVLNPAIVSKFAAGIATLASRVAMKAPDCAHYVVTSFYHPPLRRDAAEHTTLVPPILRGSVLRQLALPRRKRDFVLVYKSFASSSEDRDLLAAMADFSRVRFVVYGADKTALPPNCEPRSVSEDAFVRDLAQARAVVSNGGMSLIGEALAFGTPVYAVPIRGQYEQAMNACHLAALGYGAASERFDAASLGSFLARADDFARAVASKAQHDGNARLYALLDRFFGAPRRRGMLGPPS